MEHTRAPIRLLRLTLLISLSVVCAGTLHAEFIDSHYHEQAAQIVEDTGVRGGLIVHLGCGDGRLTAALRADDRFVVHGLDTGPGNIRDAREYIRSLGLYGPVSVEQHSGDRLPYVDNLVNLIVVEDPGAVERDELMRVLCPRGVAYIRDGDTWRKQVKPVPGEIDEWTHSLHSADNNAVSSDTVVGPPRRLQWVAEPRRARQHERLASVSAVVSAGGRIFSIQDEGSIGSVILPPRWFLVARDAFNGLVLWKKPIGPWEGHLRSFRSGPPDISRRLVAAGERVYTTLGYGQPVSALDAVTGDPVQTYEGTEDTLEILYDQGVLYLVAWDLDAAGEAEVAERRGVPPPPQSKAILAVRADTGELLWKKEDEDTASLLPVTLAVSRGRVYFQNAREILCVSVETGEEYWRAARPVAVDRPPWSAPTLVVYEDVVLSADRGTPAEVEEEPDRKHPVTWIDAPLGDLIAFSAETGERLWDSPCREGFHASVDVLVADGLVWTGEVAAPGDPGFTAGRDPLTGEIQRRRPADQEFYEVGMPHHRCHRNRGTDRYLFLGRAGVELVDLDSGQGIANHWVRGTCQFGVLPCNGLLYTPPHSCACYLEAKLNGFLALSSRMESRDRTNDVPADNPPEHGTAFGRVDGANQEADRLDDWPIYRHDAARSGYTDSPVPASLRTEWQAEVGGRLSGPTIADGKVFVASIDQHSVHALDTENGKEIWRFTAGGRIDSPPTISGGTALFGSADGCVYCLRASDGDLIWRFRAEREPRKVTAFGQLESSRPVHGSVLVEDNVVSFAAGRSSYLDGGIDVYRLDAATGEELSRTNINSRDPETGFQRKGVVELFDLPGALPDVLSADDESLYMRHVRFDREGVVQAESSPHLFCPTGLLDDTWWHRSYWILGTRFYTGYRDWFRAGREVPAGRILVFDQSNVYGFGLKPEYYHWSTALEYHLFATNRKPEVIASAKTDKRLPDWGNREIRYDWSEELPLAARAMVLADKTLFVAGPPVVLNEKQAIAGISDPAVQTELEKQDAALEGQKGGLMWVVSAEDGMKLTEYELDSPPVFDGMAAADGGLFISAMDGTVRFLTGE